MPTRITADRKTDFNDLKLNQPEERLHLKDPKEAGKSLKEKLGDLKKDKRPVQFSTPIYNPITPETLTVVHTKNSPATGGLFGKTRSGGTQPHGGVDIQADIGTDVLAAEDGVVTKAGWGTDYGKVIYVDHRDGYQTRYAHLSEMNVKVGEIVKKGELIGESGKTGNADSPDILPHLHFEVRKLNENGAYEKLDPIGFITTPRPDRDFRLLLEGIDPRTNYLPKWLS
jgi:murein DD-endopeptidase MepM/ murein hydrolase activator NlpD